jgi:hypothetical protein
LAFFQPLDEAQVLHCRGDVHQDARQDQRNSEPLGRVDRLWIHGRPQHLELLQKESEPGDDEAETHHLQMANPVRIQASSVLSAAK